MNEKWLWISNVLKRNIIVQKRIKKCATIAAAIWNKILRLAKKQTKKIYMYKQKSINVDYFCIKKTEVISFQNFNKFIFLSIFFESEIICSNVSVSCRFLWFYFFVIYKCDVLNE